ncbi:Zn-finger in Ran binding protein [Novymonas esmeraldas]|uniref:Zn-finger in Ran binding protein n=1 Tax=Novymonas esmeraldas TaxID=1808958 RepID=A0AAW0F1Z1_9TRYP
MRSAVRTVEQRASRAFSVCSTLAVTPFKLHASVAPSVRCDSARRYATTTRPLRQSWSLRSQRPWMCVKESCRTVNRDGCKECVACGEAKPLLLGWKCVGCSTVNFSGVRACKKCSGTQVASKNFWMCAVCHENNRVDEVEDNSRCGFCGYDMAPPSEAEEEILRRAKELSEAQHQQQVTYDSISFREGDEQFEDPLDGAEGLDPSLRTSRAFTGTTMRGRSLKLPVVAPFSGNHVNNTATQHSKLHGRAKRRSALAMVTDAATTPVGPPGFDWMCRNASCGQINPGDEESCLKCGTHIDPTEWECPQCAAVNFHTRASCFNCKTRIPVCWTCTACHGTTSVYDKACRTCGADRPAVEPRSPRDVAHRLGGAGGYVQQAEKGRGDWYCSACSALNFSRRQTCFQCHSSRPAPTPDAAAVMPSYSGWGEPASGGGAPAPAPPSVQHNNWICTSCQASNFRTRHNCWKCGLTSGRAGEWSSESVTPQFEREGFQSSDGAKSAEGTMNSTWKVSDDWLCAKCYSKNFKNRLECYRCGSRKTTLAVPRGSGLRKPVKL